MGMDFPSGPVVEHPPASARDTSSIPGPEGFHMLQGILARAPQLLGLNLQTDALQQEKPPQWEPMHRN